MGVTGKKYFSYTSEILAVKCLGNAKGNAWFHLTGAVNRATAGNGVTGGGHE